MARGGKRPGAGRPKKLTPEEAAVVRGAERVRERIGAEPDLETDGERRFESAMDFLTAVMNDSIADLRIRVDAAKAIMPYQKKKHGDETVKEKIEKAATNASNGRFAPSAPPKLIVNNN